jgi:hypothetical protein
MSKIFKTQSETVDKHADKGKSEEIGHSSDTNGGKRQLGNAGLDSAELERLLRLRAERVQRTPKCARVKFKFRDVG